LIGAGLSLSTVGPRLCRNIRSRIADKGELVCGIAVVERRQGRILGYLRFKDGYDEIFDIKVLPNFQHGGILGVDDDTTGARWCCRDGLSGPRRPT
jgi:hypothetical protein